MQGSYHNKIEDGVDTNRYFITYADIITLLLGLFVILYASSKVDEEKYKEFSKAFGEYFKPGGEKILDGGSGVLEGNRNGIIPEPILQYEQRSLEDVFQLATEALSDYIKRGAVHIEYTKSGIILTLPEKLLFQSGKADIQVRGLDVLDTLSGVLKNIPFQITVDGHTDSRPIRTFSYESNWHLSVARSLNVAYSLIQKGLTQNNLVIRGFGDQRPIIDNSSDESRAKNRRVEITISNLPLDVPSTEGYKKAETTK